MTVKEARLITEGRLVFGDNTQIEAVNLLELLQGLITRGKVQKRTIHISGVAHLIEELKITGRTCESCDGDAKCYHCGRSCDDCGGKGVVDYRYSVETLEADQIKRAIAVLSSKPKAVHA